MAAADRKAAEKKNSNPTHAAQRIVADLTWVDGALQREVAIDVDEAGVIRGVGPADGRTPVTRRLAGRMLLPGFVSAHSHAFQRALRGSGETFPAGVGDFWSWREAMFALVERLTPAMLRQVCRETFEEMLAVGITTVGEFHYVHHAEIERADFALDREVIAAAAEAGIRLCLLQSYYRTGHFDQPLAGGQRRFATTDVPRFIAGCDALAAMLDPRTQALGIAPHSLRAVPPEDLKALARAADERGWVVHIHVEEQRREVEDCVRALGTNPLRWMLDQLPLGERWCIVHGTHSTADDLRAYARTGGRHCVCPITEGNLGDGIALLPEMLARPGAVCIGTDSNVRLDPAEELRWLEFVQRLAAQRRGVVKTPEGRVGARLLEIGTRNGVAALGLATGEIAAGLAADFVAIDISDVSLRGCAAENLLDAYLLGSGAQAVREVCVGGRWVR
ncbi:MAG: formimidoylglutamate deiminase [Phycisphaerales bacterium]|nr:formimidoylglutamate deiminase [Phycisphaerales bacterium]